MIFRKLFDVQWIAKEIYLQIKKSMKSFASSPIV